MYAIVDCDNCYVSCERVFRPDLNGEDCIPMEDMSKKKSICTSRSFPGKHTLKVIMMDPEIVVEQIVVNPDNNHYSYFGK